MLGLALPDRAVSQQRIGAIALLLWLGPDEWLLLA